MLERVVYAPSLEASPDRPYPFIYYIHIQNHSEETVILKGRKWVVQEDDGRCNVVEGDGVVGEFPRLEPGQVFSYNSYMTVGTDSQVKGTFFGFTDAGEAVMTPVLEFVLECPETP